MKRTLDYPYTCPSLDALILDAKFTLEDHVESILYELNPVLEEIPTRDVPVQIKEWIEQQVLAIYSDLEVIFESCRTINEDIRSAADFQIGECIDELEDALNTIQELENQ